MNRYALIEELSAAIVYNRDLGRGDRADWKAWLAAAPKAKL